jgi:hypothetical protein
LDPVVLNLVCSFTSRYHCNEKKTKRAAWRNSPATPEPAFCLVDKTDKPCNDSHGGTEMSLSDAFSALKRAAIVQTPAGALPHIDNGIL